MSPWRPLTGIRVLDLSRLLPGPFLSQMFAELGADVVKVEQPGVGDMARHAPPEVDGSGHWFAAVNRGKRSVAIDMKHPEGSALVRRMAARAHVLLEGFRPGVMERLDLSDASLAQLNPALVRVSLVGYGPGPLRDAPGHDVNYESVAGILAMQGTSAAPAVSGVPVADMAGAMYGAVGALAALHEARRTGKGRRVEVALAEAALAFNGVHLMRAAADDAAPSRGAWELAGAMPGYRLYRCKDDRWVALGALEGRFWDAFVDAAKDASLGPLHMDASVEAHARMEALFRGRDAEAWCRLGESAGVPLTPVLEPKEALAHPVAAPFASRVGPAGPLTREPSVAAVPGLGEHTESVLAELGLSLDEIARLKASGAIV